MAYVFHYLAVAMMGGGILGAGHGFIMECNHYRRDVPVEYRRVDDLWHRAWPATAHHGIAGMLLTPIAPLLLTQKFLTSTQSPCPSMQAGKNTLKSLLK